MSQSVHDALRLPKKKRMKPWVVFKKNWQLLLLCMPSIVATLLFHYVPIFGIILPFKEYRYADGIFGSKWVGLKYFKYFFKTPDTFRLLRNTLFYDVAFYVVSLVVNTLIALFLYEMSSRYLKKIYQTAIMIPKFLSWVVIGYITYAILNPSLGFLKQVMQMLGLNPIDVYTKASLWPFILTVVNTWTGITGYLMSYAILMGTDQALYEAATIDGATRWQQRWHISIPSLIPLLCLGFIGWFGDLMSVSFDLFYIIPRNVPGLYETVDVIATYTFRALQSGSFQIGSAVGLMLSALSLVLTIIANAFIRKVSPDNSLF